MKIVKTLLCAYAIVASHFLGAQTENSQNEIQKITETLMNYIEGTANGEPEKLKKAFHPDFNLYTILNDSLVVRSGEKYVSNVVEGKKSNRVGRIISIDYEKDAAIAKAEILIPNWRVYTDYFLLMKYEGNWKIVQKSYTYRPIQKVEEKEKEKR